MRDQNLPRTTPPFEKPQRRFPYGTLLAFCLALAAIGYAAQRPRPLPAPAALTAYVPSTRRVVLEWKPVEGASGYRIWRDGAPIGTTGGVWWSDNTAEVGATYLYRVSAKRRGEGSEQSEPVTVTVRASAYEITSIWVSLWSETAIEVSWTTNAPMKGALKFWDEQNVWHQASEGYASAASAKVTGLEQGKKYLYVITVVAEDGASLSSPTLRVWTKSPTPTGGR